MWLWSLCVFIKLGGRRDRQYSSEMSFPDILSPCRLSADAAVMYECKLQGYVNAEKKKIKNLPLPIICNTRNQSPRALEALFYWRPLPRMKIVLTLNCLKLISKSKHARFLVSNHTTPPRHLRVRVTEGWALSFYIHCSLFIIHSIYHMIYIICFIFLYVC